nr:hypothetical protein [Klebsiella michiganensis]
MTTDITELALLVSKAKASVFTLEYISQFEPGDIDSDDVDLRFEVDGRDTGTNVSIVDECGQAARVIGGLVEVLEKAQTINAAAEKLVRCKGRYHSEQNYRALAALFGVTAPDLPPLDGDSCTVTIEPFRSFVTDADLAALHRFAECCDDPESGGHDLEKEQVRRLEAIGALQRSGRISYITGFGDVLISITAGIEWEVE